MRREVPGAWGEVDADVAADRPEPHVPSLEAQRRQPEAEMVALVDGVPRLLESRVLTTPEHVERAHGRVAVALAERERLQRSPHGTGPHCFGDLPPGANERAPDLVGRSDQDEIQGVAAPGAVAPRRASRESLECAPQRGFVIHLDDPVRGVERSEVDGVVVRADPRHFQQDMERMCLAFAVELYRDELRALVVVREHVPRLRPACRDLAVDRLLFEELVHPPIGGGAKGAVGLVRGLARREVGRIDGGREQVEGDRAPVLDLDPDRLDASGGEIDAEVLAALDRTEGGDADAHGTLRLGPDSWQEGRWIGGLRMRGAAADQQRECATPESDHERGSALEVDCIKVEPDLPLARLSRRCEVTAAVARRWSDRDDAGAERDRSACVGDPPAALGLEMSHVRAASRRHHAGVPCSMWVQQDNGGPAMKPITPAGRGPRRSRADTRHGAVPSGLLEVLPRRRWRHGSRSYEASDFRSKEAVDAEALRCIVNARRAS